MNNKKVLALTAAAILMLALAVPCFATSGSTGISSDITSAFSTGFQQIASDVTSVLVVIIPIALGIFGVIWVARKAISWFRSMSKG